jgi:hypothetical protein
VRWGNQISKEFKKKGKMKKVIILGMMFFVIWLAVIGCAHVPMERQGEYPPPPSYDPVGPVH